MKWAEQRTSQVGGRFFIRQGNIFCCLPVCEGALKGNFSLRERAPCPCVHRFNPKPLLKSLANDHESFCIEIFPISCVQI